MCKLVIQDKTSKKHFKKIVCHEIFFSSVIVLKISKKKKMKKKKK